MILNYENQTCKVIPIIYYQNNSEVELIVAKSLDFAQILSENRSFFGGLWETVGRKDVNW